MPVYIDQMMRKVEITPTPLRIISLVPSQTELLFDLGLDEEVIGITKFCIHPNSWFKTKTRVGGTKKINFNTVAKLNPDLIIANKEENTESEIIELSKTHPVWLSDIKSLQDALNMIDAIGEITNTTIQAKAINKKISQSFNELLQHKKIHQKTVAYFIWNEPMMVAGHDTFINEMLHTCSLQNVFGTQSFLMNDKTSSRYPEINEQELRAAKPALILLSSEPFPFKEKHIHHFKAICPEAEIKIVDGEMFSWYGSRLMHAAAYFKTLFA